MATSKAIYLIGGSTVQVAPDVDATIGAYTAAVTRNLSAIDWGVAPRERFYRSRPVRDGDFRRGARTGRRVVSFDLLNAYAYSMATTLPLERIEQARDVDWSAILDVLYPEQGLVTIRQTSQDTALAAISRQIRGELTEYPAWEWSPDAVAAGMVGTHSGSIAVVPLAFECPFPWFEDSAPTATAALTLDSTLRNTSITNTGLVSCGIKFVIAGSGSGLSIAIANTTSGATALGGGITLTGINMASGSVEVDWYSTDPLGWSVTQGGVSIASSLSSAAGIGLVRGANTITFQVTSGTLTGGTITLSHRNLWGAP